MSVVILFGVSVAIRFQQGRVASPMPNPPRGLGTVLGGVAQIVRTYKTKHFDDLE